jgi:hypothetical protein
MRAMRTNRKLKLKQQFVRNRRVCVFGTPILSAQLAELAWPVRQDCRLTFIDQRCILGAS